MKAFLLALALWCSPLQAQPELPDSVTESSPIKPVSNTLFAGRDGVPLWGLYRVEILDQSTIRSLPVRSTAGYLSLFPGVAQLDGELYVRGGRAREIGYRVDDFNVTNPLFNDEGVTLIPEAIEQLSFYPGVVPASMGGLNSGLLSTRMRTGSDHYELHAGFATDNFVAPGEPYLGSSSLGYRRGVLTAGGPVPILEGLRFFAAFQHQYWMNRQAIFLTPFRLDSIMVGTYTPHYTTRALDPLEFKTNTLPNNRREVNTIQGTLTYQFDPLRLQFTGSYEHELLTLKSDWPSALQRFYAQARNLSGKRSTGFAGVRGTLSISQGTEVTFGASHFNRHYVTVDPDFGEDWLKYSDSVANALAGYSGFTTRWNGPYSLYAENEFRFDHPNTPNNSFRQEFQRSWSVSLDARTELTGGLGVSAGASYSSWTAGLFDIRNINSVLATLYGSRGNMVRQFGSPEERRAELGRYYINHYGYDVDGNRVDAGYDARRAPSFGTAYLQTTYKTPKIELTLGLQYHLFNTAIPKPMVPGSVPVDTSLWTLDEQGLTTQEPYHFLLPRLSLSIRPGDGTEVFVAVGEFAQMSRLDQFYVGNTRLSRTLSGNAYVTPLPFAATPERTTHVEFGMRHNLLENFSLFALLYLKHGTDLLTVRRAVLQRIPEADSPEKCFAYTNADESKLRGLELRLDLLRTHGFSARMTYGYADWRGTGSTPASLIGPVHVVPDSVIRLTGHSPLDYQIAHKVVLLVNYGCAVDEGGPILSGLDATVAMTFTSGHPYTRFSDPEWFGSIDRYWGGVTQISDPRFTWPLERTNSSTTPWRTNIDLYLGKKISLGSIALTLYAEVLNLLNARQVMNVYPTTGSPGEDGFLSTALGRQYASWDTEHRTGFVDFYRTINSQNRWSYMMATGGEVWYRDFSMGKDMYGPPRQVRFGMRVEL